MTRRERLQAKAERRREWAAKAESRSEAAFAGAAKIADGIPFGQPILRGHHSEKRHRRDAARIESGMAKGCEEAKLAEHHEAKADGLDRQLERSVFSDDADAIEQLEARIAANEAEAERHKAINRAWRKGGQAAVEKLVSPALASTIAETMRLAPWLKVPLDTAHIRAAIRRDRKRIEEIRAQQARHAQAEVAGGVTITGDRYVTVTFAEKPAREVLGALKASGFRWACGSWVGERERLPAELSGKAG